MVKIFIPVVRLKELVVAAEVAWPAFRSYECLQRQRKNLGALAVSKSCVR